MPGLQHKLIHLSRDRSALIRASMILGGVFFVIGLLLSAVPKNETPDTYWLLMTTISLAGLIWFVILTKLGGVEKILQKRTLFAFAAVGLGILSAMATAEAYEWQRVHSGLQLNGEFRNDILFWVSVVGLWEESIKMLFIIPLIPFVLRRRSEAEMLLVSSLVGLGFAIEENINYLYHNPGATMARMFMANFLHIALSGSLGLALFRFCRWPKSRWEELVVTFLVVVLIHGFYDAFIGVPELAEYGILGFILFGVTAHRHFDLILDTSEGISQKISPLGVFVLGNVCLVGLVWLTACVQAGWHSAFVIAGGSAVGSALIGFLYINRLRSE